ncbi:MAG: cytochrome c3 family protein [Deltaproteobacteria bacterium]|nr:cytochrome c3 family protein [Deltaproteobacteria bacterium]
MKKTSYIIAVFACIVLISATGIISSRWTSYHDFEGKCLDCHLSVPGEDGKPGTFNMDITVMCTDCHKEALELSHPVDRRPTMALPAVFIVNWKGEITCITCHPAHQAGFGDYHLRAVASGEGFCISCHSDIEERMHKVSIASAHVGQGSLNRELPVAAGILLDELSLRCMACHDAVVGVDAVVENRSVTLGFHNPDELELSHPVGVSYMEAKRKYRGAYRDPDKLPAEIKLFDGQVGCATCHNPYSKRHSELVMSNAGSALCLACHRK